MLSHLKFAFRSLTRTPGFTAVAVLTLALGIGLNTSMFSLINTFLLRPLKFPDAGNIYLAQRTTAQQTGAYSPAAVEEILRASTDFTELAVYRNWGFTLSAPNRPAEVVSSHRVSANYFEVLGVKPELGRGFLPGEDQPGANNVVVLSHAFWLSHFGGDSAVIGQNIRLDGAPVQVVGILPASAAAPMVFGSMNMYRPLGLTSEEKTNWTDNAYILIGRYRAAFPPAQTNARFASIASRLATDHPKENAGSGMRLVSLQSSGLGDTGRYLTFMLLGLSFFVLVIACANLANLLLARALSRAREFAIRAALGASRSQLIQPLITVCLAIASTGGGLGLIISSWISDWMTHRFSSADSPIAFALDWRVLTFAVFASLVTGLLFGVVPAWLVSRVRVNETLKNGTRGSTSDRSHHRFRQTLIVGQFSLALVLLAGALFFVRGFEQLLHRRAGWNPAPLLRGTLSLPTGTYSNADRTMAFYTQLQQRLAVLPGVDSVAVSYDLPMFGFPSQRNYIIENHAPPVAGHEPLALVNGVSEGYFDTVGTHLLRGRSFKITDRLDSPGVVIINEAMAGALFPNEEAVGRRLNPIGEKKTRSLEIVGVVEDVRFLNVGPAPVSFQLYLPLAQEPWNYAVVTLRTSRAAESLMEPFRRTVAQLDPEMPVQDLLPVPVSIERNIDDLKFIEQLLTGFAALGLFLAALGIYGVIAHIVAQRTNEIGIRMALGAQLGQIARLILGAGLRLVFAGTFLGLIGAFCLAHFLTLAMPGLSGDNSVTTIVSATVGLITTACLACWLPARRATKVDPVIALRAD